MNTQYYFFIEQPYLGYSVDAAAKHGSSMVTFSNTNFDPERAAKLYDRWHATYKLAEDVGFDGIMINEHHNTPGCMQASPNITATVLAKITERVKILMAGNILPLWDDPLKLAEEIAMIDLFSKGRVISGFVRGTGMESITHNVNTMYNRERFNEAHDLVIKAWTTPGPFRWQGKHYEYRVVNPWVLPLQKPHPRVMVPGVVSSETVTWSAAHGYPYIALATQHDATEQIFTMYDRVASEHGINVTSDHHGYLVRVHVAPTDEEAHEQARKMFGRREAQVTSHNNPEVMWNRLLAWNAPPGYMSPEATRRFYQALAGGSPYSFYTAEYEKAVEIDQIVVGSPETVARKIRGLADRHNLGHVSIWHFPTEDEAVTRTNLELIGERVLPALRGPAATSARAAS